MNVNKIRRALEALEVLGLNEVQDLLSEIESEDTSIDEVELNENIKELLEIVEEHLRQEKINNAIQSLTEESDKFDEEQIEEASEIECEEENCDCAENEEELEDEDAEEIETELN